jgi:amino acid adenylation domain-containing protein
MSSPSPLVPLSHPGDTIPECIEHFARTLPDRTAVKTRVQEFTWAELNRAANRVARAILAGGDPGRGPVAVLIPRGAGLTVALLAVSKTGRAYAPLNPAHPPERTRHILNDSQALTLVTNRAHLALARELAGDRVAVVDLDALAPLQSDANLGVKIAPDEVAGITYTSGSTGKPKGVMQSHRSTLHRRAAAQTFDIGPEDRVAAVGSAGTDNYRALLNGAASYPWAVKEEGFADLPRWLREERVSVYLSVPSVFRDFVASLGPGERLPDMRLIILRGETLYRSDVDLYRRHFEPHCVLVNELGSMETRTVAQFPIDHTTVVTEAIVPVGHVLRDKTVLILGEDRRPLPPGEIGEIAVRSRYLSPGYWGQPDLTRERFLPDPAGGDEHTYLTGDMGRFLPDGRLVHLGRKDTQVKIRAQRVEIGEIEAALRALAGVREAAVVAREDQPGDKRLVAYVGVTEPPGPTVTALRRALAATLPDYVVPGAFVVMDRLPLTPSGKVDRLRLPDPGRARPRLDEPMIAPRTPLEATLAEIWREVLGLDALGVRDGFLDLGGSSLVALRLHAEIERRSGRRVPLASLFDAPTVERQAALLDGDAADGAPRSLVAIQPKGAGPALYCVPGHGGTVVCFHELARQLGPEQPLYALQPRGLDDDRAPATRIEEMAAEYLEEIRERQPAGPYLLGGFCLGALVAFEMARRLHAAGEQVGLLALFDPRRPELAPGLAFSSGLIERGARRLTVEYENLRLLAMPERLAYGRAKTRSVVERIGRRVARRTTGLREVEPRVAALQQAQRTAARAFRAHAYPGAVLLFMAQRPFTQSYVDPSFGWGRLARELTVRLVPLPDGSVIQHPDGARVVAAELRERIGRLDDRAGAVIRSA